MFNCVNFYHLGRVIWKSLLVLYAKDVLRDLVTVHHSGQPRWKYCSQVTSMVFGEALSRLYLSSFSPDDRKKIAKEVWTIKEFCIFIFSHAPSNQSLCRAHCVVTCKRNFSQITEVTQKAKNYVYSCDISGREKPRLILNWPNILSFAAFHTLQN